MIERHKYEIVDADAHTFSPKDMWERWLPREFQDRRPRLVKDQAGGDAWLYGADRSPEPLGLTFTAGLRYEDFRWYGLSYEDIRPGCYDGKARLADMDQDGIDAEILFSDNRTMGYFMNVTDPEFQLAGVQAYNNWLVEEFCAPDPSRLIGLAQIPNIGVEGAIAELRRMKARGVKSILLRAWPSCKPEISAEDDAFWAACEELEVPICNHGFLGGGGGQSRGNIFSGPTAALSIGVGPAAVTGFIAQMIATGVFDRFPSLKVGSIETQAGWVPYFLEQMDDKYFRNRVWGDVRLKYLPSEYWKRNFFVTFMIDQYGIHNRHFIGVDTMMWSSDYPHHGNDWPYSRKVIQYEFAGVPEEEKRKIICDNAVRIFRLA
jgi:predicted TIM-barrel fold metal-dependent hydrolase